MTRALLVVAVLLTGHAFADIADDDDDSSQCSKAGSACTTHDGAAGTCVVRMVSKLDYTDGVPPKTKQVQMLICVATASATVRAAPPFLAAGLVMFAMLALIGVKLAGRGRRSATA